MEGIGLNELTLNHQSSLQTPPARLSGTNTIDGIDGTRSLDTIRGRYIPCIRYMDHRLELVDINQERVLGIFQKVQCPIVARRLQCDNPRTVKMYLMQLQEQLDAVDITGTIINLEATVAIPPSAVDAKKTEDLDKTITIYM